MMLAPEVITRRRARNDSIVVGWSPSPNVEPGSIRSTRTPTVGARVTYTLNVANAGPDAATGVKVRELMPTGLSLVSATASLGAYDATSGIWDIGTVGSGERQTLTIVATVTRMGSIVNRAEVLASDVADPNSTPGKWNPGENDQASAPLIAHHIPAVLAIVKQLPETASQGQLVNYTVTVKNISKVPVYNARLTDSLPSGTSLVRMPVNGRFSRGLLSWNLGTMAPGASRTVRVTVKVGTGTTGNHRTHAEALGVNARAVQTSPSIRVTDSSSTASVPVAG